MTTVFLSVMSCCSCGTKGRYPLVDLNMSIVGPRDLDGRPSLTHRSSVYSWVQRCDACGYCAPEISQGRTEELNVIELLAYKDQLTDMSYPDTANSFLCHSMIMEQVNLFSDAGWAAVFAAWVCDDNEYCESAIKCRGKALSLFAKATEQGQQFGDSISEELLFIIDLHRRRGEFEIALALCNREIEKMYSNRIMDLLFFERYLLEKNDRSCKNENDEEYMSAEELL